MSRVLNAPHKVSPATRERVLTAIDELEFVPKAEAVARSRRAIGADCRRCSLLHLPLVYRAPARHRDCPDRRPVRTHHLVVDSAARRDAYLASLAVTGRVDRLVLLALPFGEAMAGRLLSYKIETVLVEYVRAPFSTAWRSTMWRRRLVGQYF